MILFSWIDDDRDLWLATARHCWCTPFGSHATQAMLSHECTLKTMGRDTDAEDRLPGRS